MTELGYSDYRHTEGERVISTAAVWEELSLSFLAPAVPYQVELFIPHVQSTSESGLVSFFLADNGQQVGRIICQALPNTVNLQTQTYGPLIYRRRFPSQPGTTHTFQVLYQAFGNPWKTMLATAGENVAYLRAETV
jgi:hypothetical protein